MKKSIAHLLQPVESPQNGPDSAAEKAGIAPLKPRPETTGRRDFLQKAGLGGLSLGGLMMLPVEDTIAHTASKVNRLSNPSELKITDMRIAQYGNVPILKIYTNQGIHGLGDVRDGADKRYALMLKSRILGENPCNIEKIFKKIEQFGGHGRQGGGVSGVEMALWDLAGKAYGVPLYMLLGGKFRDKVRIYVDTPTMPDPDQFAEKMKERVDLGFTMLKMDIGIGLIKDIEDTLTNKEPWMPLRGWTDRDVMSHAQTRHQHTHIQITQKGLEKMVEFAAKAREKVGYEIPLAIDHFGHMGYNEMIKLARAFEPYNIAWLEDLIPWQNTEQWKRITEAITTPTLTGEDTYHKKNFKDLIENRAVDIVHPDPGSAGGYLQTKKIGDYAEEFEIGMAIHHAASPITFMGTVHAAAATYNFIGLEHHSVDNPWWESLVTGIDGPFVENGYVKVPEAPGVGLELNEEEVKRRLRPGEEFFAPTDEWNELRSWDRTWS
ncbi:MAG: mandelate racemase/muconate lactonizing enzyme family protein [Lunatimonas sp.]|uniref:mandelate racemase/muconate lactonizing enzyme family protein n=1 Tax=Lunatimonas sp. TaxID=2060141 RepID=UPI00263ACB47|nr:mandelate racemase/muconate lactonizing enzyme family protein [Lunatimonas sp.]MCC5935888.1 mandelate racemase/muconate lactonizing enzyme family protein [Lunatimonas sp.]